MYSLFDCIEFSFILITSYLCSSIIFTKATKSKLSIVKKIVVIISSFIIGTVCVCLRVNGFYTYRLIFLLLTIGSFVFFIGNKKELFVTSISALFSIAISYCMETICILVMGSVFYFWGYREVNLFTQLFSSILQFILTFFFVRIKRFANGFTFLNNRKNWGIYLIFSGPIIILTTIQKDTLSRESLIILLISLIVSTTGLFLWIHSAFKRYYRKRLKLRAEEYSKIELAEKQKEIEKLLNENASLSSIIHLDNHLINKLESTLNNYKNDELIKDLLTLSKQRKEYVNNKIISDKLLPTTGNNDIDAAISDMYIKTASRGIDFTLNANCDVNYLIHNIIEQTDFEKLIRHCITNSIVNIENNPDTNGKILITISKPNDIYEFTIMDNGVSKEDSIKPISEIIEKSKASIKTNKFDNNDSFTKSLTIRFDGLKDELKNKY